MSMRVLALFFFLMTLPSYGYYYSDYDIDGVEDSIDACPNTPFET